MSSPTYTCSSSNCLGVVYKSSRYCIKHTEAARKREEKTASVKVKDTGLKSLSLVSKMTGTSMQTLDNWSKNKPKLFSVVLSGCLYEIDKYGVK